VYAPPAGDVRIAINAQKLSTRQSFHAAGSSRYVFNLLKELRLLGAPEHILAYLANDVDLPAELRPTDRFRVRVAGVPTVHPAVRVAWEQLAFSRALRHDGVTLLHGPINALPLSWTGRSVVTILDLTFLLLPAAIRRASRTYLRWMVRFAARHASRVITISESTRRDVIRLLGVPPERVTRVYCGVDERFHPIDDTRRIEEFRSSLGLPNEFILYLGTIEPRKNLIRLIDAYAELRRRRATSLPLILAGGRGWGDHEIVRRAEETGLGDQIRFAGFVPEEQIPLWYNAATVFTYPSEYEGFGLPPLEALACGVPVVASNSSSLPEVLGDAAVLVDPASVGAIADGIQRALDDDALRSTLVTRGLDRAGTFSWRRMAEETLSVYRSVLAQP
jgi:glycosyltransferase involved in cell wall biosynthesis